MKKKGPPITLCDECNEIIDDIPKDGWIGFASTKEGYLYCGRCFNTKDKFKKKREKMSEDMKRKYPKITGEVLKAAAKAVEKDIRRPEYIKFEDLSDEEKFYRNGGFEHKLAEYDEGGYLGTDDAVAIGMLRSYAAKQAGKMPSLPRGFKVYKCTDCHEVNIKKDNGRIRVGFCDNCEPPYLERFRTRSRRTKGKIN